MCRVLLMANFRYEGGENSMWAVIILILSIIIAIMITGKLNENTIGTTGAYLKRGFVVWVITYFALYGYGGRLPGQDNLETDN